MILAREQRLALQHFRENTSCAPYINFDIVFLPCKHNLRSTIVSRRDVTSHLRILYAGKAEVAYLQITILIHENVAGFKVSMDNAGRVNIFESSLCLHQLCCWH